MNFTACITTMNRPQELNACLQALWGSNVKPFSVIVSDNSPSSEVQEQNRNVVKQYANTTYLLGPQKGVSSNRNNAFSAVTPNTDLVSFLADDICVEPDFIALAIERYSKMSLEEKNYTILSGKCIDESQPNASDILALSFRGYFCPSNVPQVVFLAASVFPRSFFTAEKWDENIYLGQEDAEISLRALKAGYSILHCPELKVVDISAGTSTMDKGGKKGRLTDYDIYAEASRLYIGIKRYKHIFPNTLKLIGFVSTFFAHMTVYLLKRGAIADFPEIVRRSNIQRLFGEQVTPKSNNVADVSWGEVK